jgi:4-amino-4-deoxy-L-arabinose transferase-like glycosyltransferase
VSLGAKPPTPEPAVSRRALLALLIVFAAVWFSTLETRKLIKPDEGRYAEIAREMAASGDWVTPRLNGIKYFEKPPLQYWATAAAFKVFGEHHWTARLWTGLTGFCGVLLAYFAGRRLFGTTAGLLSAAVLASGVMYFAMGHLNTLDMGLTFFLQFAVCAFLLANRSTVGPRTQRNWMLVAWAAAALAILSKGLLALVLPGATLVAYSLATRDFAPWRRLHVLPGLALMLMIAAPWFVAVSLANPEFLHFFFVHEHFERFLSPGHRRTQPWWYFAPVLLAGALPWATMALHALASAWRGHGGDEARAARFFALWSVLTFGFFSLSSSKLPSYVLPILPAFALLTGAWLARTRDRTMQAHLLLVLIVALAALAATPLVGRRADAETTLEMMQGLQNWLTVGALAWVVATAAALWLARRGRVARATLALAVGGCAVAVGLAAGHDRLSRSNSAYHIAAEIRLLVRPDVPFYSVRMYDQTLPFYLQRTFTLVEYSDEMGFGLQQEPERAVVTLADFEARWRSGNDAFAVMEGETYELLRQGGLSMTIVARDTRRIIVRKP